jgi:hypothetical protein
VDSRPVEGACCENLSIPLVRSWLEEISVLLDRVLDSLKVVVGSLTTYRSTLGFKTEHLTPLDAQQESRGQPGQRILI